MTQQIPFAGPCPGHPGLGERMQKAMALICFQPPRRGVIWEPDEHSDTYWCSMANYALAALTGGVYVILAGTSFPEAMEGARRALRMVPIASLDWMARDPENQAVPDKMREIALARIHRTRRARDLRPYLLSPDPQVRQAAISRAGCLGGKP